MARADRIEGKDKPALYLAATAERSKEIAERMLEAGAEILWEAADRRLSAMFPDPRFQLPYALGITPVAYNKKGYYDIKVGFGGYQDTAIDARGRERELFPWVPVQLIGRVVENGRSGPFEIKARPFMSPAVRETRSSVKAAMEKAAEQAMEEIAKKGA